jgi:hypothetical protein
LIFAGLSEINVLRFENVAHNDSALPKFR